jgi:hypothetical protein
LSSIFPKQQLQKFPLSNLGAILIWTSGWYRRKAIDGLSEYQKGSSISLQKGIEKLGDK